MEKILEICVYEEFVTITNNTVHAYVAETIVFKYFPNLMYGQRKIIGVNKLGRAPDNKLHIANRHLSYAA